MAKPTIKLQFILTDQHGMGLFVTIDGRQALEEGPRVGVGHCAYCKGQCEGRLMMCDRRVYDESSRGGKKGKRGANPAR